jgi:hypothetical protein
VADAFVVARNFRNHFVLLDLLRFYQQCFQDNYFIPV